MRVIARTFLVTWVGFWLLFAIASRLGEGATAEGLVTLTLRGGTLVVLALVGWFAPAIGGWLFALVGLLLLSGAFRFAQGPYLPVRLMLGGPPLAVGVILLMAARRRPRGESSQE